MPKSEVTEAHQGTTATASPPPPLQPEPESRPAVAGKVSAARAAVQRFLSTELGAREIRITKLVPLDHGSQGWSAEAEILVPDLEVKMLGLPLTQEVLECERYSIELETDLTVRSYGAVGAYDD